MFGKLLSDFKAFILRGNVVDLAVGVVIGAAFQTVVKAFVDDIISPIIPTRTPQGLATLEIPIYGGHILGNHFIKIGDFANTFVSFLIVAAVIFFLVVRPINMLTAFGKRVMPTEETHRDCPFCLSSIPIKATRCAFCTSEVPAVLEKPRSTLSRRLGLPNSVRSVKASKHDISIGDIQ
jgi:large conductance mechanosensitive channel